MGEPIEGFSESASHRCRMSTLWADFGTRLSEPTNYADRPSIKVDRREAGSVPVPNVTLEAIIYQARGRYVEYYKLGPKVCVPNRLIC